MVGKRDFRSYLPMFMEISFICALIIHYMYLYSMFTQCFVYSKFLLLRSVATLNPRSGVSVERCIKLGDGSIKKFTDMIELCSQEHAKVF